MNEPLLQASELAQLADPPAPPVQVQLPEAGPVTVEAWLRVLPGRRWVARARRRDETLLLKLYVGPRSRRHQRRELRGARALLNRGLPAPALVGEGVATDAAFVLYEWLAAAEPVAASDDQGVCAVAALLGQLHEAGLTQTDLHLGNFLSTAGRLYAVDGAGIRPRRNVLVPGLFWSLERLGLLAAQRPPACDGTLPALLSAYAQARGWNLAGPRGRILGERLQRATRRQRHRRVQRYLQKTERNCSEFLQETRQGHRLLAVRAAWSPALAAVAADPERFLDAGERLKSGRTATVARIRLPGNSSASALTLVLKRYNIRSLRHRLRISLKCRGRARVAWRNGQLLPFLDIPTARPLLLLEQFRGPLRDTAYLVMEDLGDRDLAGAVNEQGPQPRWADGAARLLRDLARAELVHGDTKATNLLLAGERLHLIDLDALRAGDAAGVRADQRRFLANWPAGSEARVAFALALTEAGLTAD